MNIDNEKQLIDSLNSINENLESVAKELAKISCSLSILNENKILFEKEKKKNSTKDEIYSFK